MMIHLSTLTFERCLGQNDRPWIFLKNSKRCLGQNDRSWMIKATYKNYSWCLLHWMWSVWLPPPTSGIPDARQLFTAGTPITKQEQRLECDKPRVPLKEFLQEPLHTLMGSNPMIRIIQTRRLLCLFQSQTMYYTKSDLSCCIYTTIRWNKYGIFFFEDSHQFTSIDYWPRNIIDAIRRRL